MTKSTALWNKDGKGGADDPNTSEKILLDWLKAEGNYRNYRGTKNGGHTKECYAKQIQSLLVANQVHAKRYVRHITMKIADWEKKISLGMVPYHTLPYVDCHSQLTFFSRVKNIKYANLLLGNLVPHPNQ
jgi:hypothetical protein